MKIIMKKLKDIDFKKQIAFRKIKTISKTQLETIVGGPETSRGTETGVGKQ